jgi:hypothetical protein
MDVSKILSEIDAEIARLQQARSAIVGLSGGAVATVKAKRGRPKGSVNAVKPAAPAKRKRNLSPEGRKRIQEAMKKRWADRRKELARKEAPKKEASKK